MENHNIRIAHIAEFEPGTMKCFRIGEKRLLIAYSEGQFFAVDEMCTHEDASLCTGSLKNHYVKCPLHGSRFDLNSGEALDDPADEPLRTYPIEIIDGEIFVNLNDL